jgi:UDP-N-acetylglucosamine 2-epimerase (non-hydrolysing)
MKKILTIVGTRPEIIKLSCLLPKLDKFFNHKLIHTGQNFDDNLNKIFFKDLNLRNPDYKISLKNKSLFNNLGEILSGVENIIKNFKPDAVLILGDTNSGLSVLVAKKFKIPIFHLEAGNRCFDERVPEETNRKIIDHISDINLVYTEHAKLNLIKEGFPPRRIVKSGSPMPEIIENYKKKINDSKILKKLKIKKNDYILISSHREENLDSNVNFNNLIFLLKKLKSLKKKIVVSVHPRFKKKLLSKKIFNKLSKSVFLNKPFSFTDYINLQKNSFLIFSDSGSIVEESAILKLNSVIIREAHERPEGDDEGINILYDMDRKNFAKVMKILKEYKKQYKLDIPKDYRSKNFSQIVINTIISKINYINKYIYFN